MTNYTMEQVLLDMIDRYGLAAVYEFVREQPGFCENCGTPIGNEIHYPYLTGACEIRIPK